MGELRTLLERAAEDYEPPAAEYAGTLERARRLQLRRRVGIVMLAIAIAAGGLLAVNIAFITAHTAPATRTPTPPIVITPTPETRLTGQILYKCGNSFCLMDGDGTHRRDAHWQDAPGPQWDPAFSPDGSKVAYRGYYGQGDGMYALYVANPDGTNPRRVTRDIAGDPSWSPDGKRIVFDTSGAGSIVVVNADGSGLRALTRGVTPGNGRSRPASGFEDWFPAWSPDGRSIAFARRAVGPLATPFQIYVMRSDGSNVTRLTNNVVSFVHPGWSPDGRSIAADGLVGDQSQIYAVDPGGPGVHALTSGPGQSWNPQWAPDGSAIAFLSDRGGSIGVYVMKPGGSDVRLVAANLVPAATPSDVQFAWAP